MDLKSFYSHSKKKQKDDDNDDNAAGDVDDKSFLYGPFSNPS